MPMQGTETGRGACNAEMPKFEWVEKGGEGEYEVRVRLIYDQIVVFEGGYEARSVIVVGIC